MGRRYPGGPVPAFSRPRRALASVALRGFELFETALSCAWDDGRPDASTALDRLSRAYLDFAHRARHYSAMFEAGIPFATGPELRSGRTRVAVLRGAAEKICAEISGQRRPPALMVALHISSWRMASRRSFGRGDSARRPLPMTAEELLEAEVLVYLRGLGMEAKKPERGS